MMDGLVRNLKYWFGLLDRPGMAGLALLAAALGVFASVVAPTQERMASLERDIEALRKAPPTADKASPGADVQLARFYKSLPQAGSTPDWLQKIYEAANANQVALDQGEYVLLSDGTSRLDQYRIIFPLKGAYPQLRKFAADVLENVPASALESVTFKREKIADGMVEAKISFLLYVERAK